MKRQWVHIKNQKPTEGQKIYYFSKNTGIFRGEYHLIKSVHQASCPHKFSSNHGVLDGNDVSHWMPYDHAYRDMIPLPPDYNKVPLENSVEEINISENNFYFTATTTII